MEHKHQICKFLIHLTKKNNIPRPSKSKITINAFTDSGYTCLHLHTLYTLKYIKVNVLGTFFTLYYNVIFNCNNCYQKQKFGSNWHQ